MPLHSNLDLTLAVTLFILGIPIFFSIQSKRAFLTQVLHTGWIVFFFEILRTYPDKIQFIPAPLRSLMQFLMIFVYRCLPFIAFYFVFLRLVLQLFKSYSTQID